ncbi:hypothetical protein FK85_23485, partial [Halorubrum saccharovorum]
MTDTDDSADAGWFAGGSAADSKATGDGPALRARIVDGEADEPRDWPELAVESGFAGSRDDYYDRLHGASVAATRAADRERERATINSSSTRCGPGTTASAPPTVGRARRRVGWEPVRRRRAG